MYLTALLGAGETGASCAGKKIHEPFNKLKLNCTLHISLKPWLFKLRYVRERYSSKNREYFSDMEFTKYHICWIVRKEECNPWWVGWWKNVDSGSKGPRSRPGQINVLSSRERHFNSHKASPWKNWEDAGRGRGAEQPTMRKRNTPSHFMLWTPR